MKEDLDYNLYVLAEIAYKKEHENLSDDDLFPFDWYSIRNYKLKVEIISEAIKEKKLIFETKLYNERIEGIRNE